MEWIAEKWDIIIQLYPFLLKGLWLTFQISMIAILLGSLIGFVLGAAKTTGFRALNGFINLYLHLLRGSPYLVQLYIVYFRSACDRHRVAFI